MASTKTVVLRAFKFTLAPTAAQEQQPLRWCGTHSWRSTTPWPRSTQRTPTGGPRSTLSWHRASGSRWPASRSRARRRRPSPLCARRSSPSVATPARGGGDGVRPWAHEVNTHVFQSAFIDADRAWKNWLDSFKGTRERRRVGYPRFKKRGRARDAFHLHHMVTKPTIRFSTRRRLRLPTFGEVRLHDSARTLVRQIDRGTAVVQSVTVSRAGHRWYASVLCARSRWTCPRVSHAPSRPPARSASTSASRPSPPRASPSSRTSRSPRCCPTPGTSPRPPTGSSAPSRRSSAARRAPPAGRRHAAASPASTTRSPSSARVPAPDHQAPHDAVRDDRRRGPPRLRDDTERPRHDGQAGPQGPAEGGAQPRDPRRLHDRGPPADHLQDFLVRLPPRPPRGPRPLVVLQQDLLDLRVARPKPHARRPGIRVRSVRTHPGPRPQRGPQHREARNTGRLRYGETQNARGEPVRLPRTQAKKQG